MEVIEDLAQKAEECKSQYVKLMYNEINPLPTDSHYNGSKLFRPLTAAMLNNRSISSNFICIDSAYV